MSMDRTKDEVGWFHDFAEWISYNPRTVALGIYFAGLILFVAVVGVLTRWVAR